MNANTGKRKEHSPTLRDPKQVRSLSPVPPVPQLEPSDLPRPAVPLAQIPYRARQQPLEAPRPAAQPARPLRPQLPAQQPANRPVACPVRQVVQPPAQPPGMYNGWNVTTERFASMLFTDVVPFEAMLREFEFTDFANRPARETVMNRIRAIPKMEIVRRDLRYPEVGCFVCLSEGALNEYLSQIFQACTYTESESSGSQPGRNRYDDIKLSFYKAVANAMALLRRRHSSAGHVYLMYTQQTFESVNHLRWVGQAAAAPAQQ